MKKIIFPLFVFVLVVIGCSASHLGESSNDVDLQGNASLQNKKLAQDYFIRGALHDLKGEYSSAILEYQEALKLDEQAGIHYALSKDYLIIKKLVPALEHSKSAVKLSPNDTEYNFLLGNIYKIAQRPDSAEIFYEKVIKIDSLYYQAYYNIAQLNELSKPLKALDVYSKLLKLRGQEWSVLVRIAELNERMGNVNKTIKTVEKLLHLNPSNLQLEKLLIESYLKTNENEKAIALASDALNMFPDDLTLIEYKGNAKAKQNKWKDAAIEYNKLIHSKKLRFEVKKRIVSGFITEAERDSTIIPIAKEMLLEIEKDSTDWQINAFLGEIELQSKNDSVAISYFKKSAMLAPWKPQIWNRLGILLFESQLFDEAIAEMKKAVEKFPDDFVDNLILGLSLSQQNNLEEAERALEHAVRLNPNDLTALHAYGFTLNRLKKNEIAIVYLDKALSLDSNNIQVIGTLGLIYDSMKNYKMSDSLYERAMLIDSTDVLIANNYAYSLSERGEKLDKALRLAQFAISKEPESSSYLDTMGWVYFKLGEYDKAIEFITKAIDRDEGNATLYDHLADVYRKKNDKNKAIELYEKALLLDSSMDAVKEKLEGMDEK